MAKKVNAPAVAAAAAPARRASLPLDGSVGYQVRLTHRLIQRELQSRIAPYGVQLGMWYLLRVLWEEDGLTQRQLSQRIGIMEPTTLHTSSSTIALLCSIWSWRSKMRMPRRRSFSVTGRGFVSTKLVVPVIRPVFTGWSSKG